MPGALGGHQNRTGGTQGAHHRGDAALDQAAGRGHRRARIAGLGRRLELFGVRAGELREFDTPANLLKNPGSIFSSMVDDTGPENARLLRQVSFVPNPGVSSRIDPIFSRLGLSQFNSCGFSRIASFPIWSLPSLLFLYALPSGPVPRLKLQLLLPCFAAMT